MDSLTKGHLEARIAQEVQTMLTEGDREYLGRLPRSALLDVIETELRFLGLYSHDDHETPAVIHGILEKYLDAWSEKYLYRPKVHINNSPFQQVTSSGNVGITWTEATYYVSFPSERPHIEVSPIPE